MRVDAAIETTHIGQSIVQIAVIMLKQRTLSCIISF
jgi:hypothetical protein